MQHEIFVGRRAAIFEPGRTATIQINCRSETNDLAATRIPYGLVVTVETASELPIYDEIRARIRPPVRVGVTVGDGTDT